MAHPGFFSMPTRDDGTVHPSGRVRDTHEDIAGKPKPKPAPAASAGDVPALPAASETPAASAGDVPAPAASAGDVPAPAASAGDVPALSAMSAGDAPPATTLESNEERAKLHALNEAPAVARLCERAPRVPLDPEAAVGARAEWVGQPIVDSEGTVLPAKLNGGVTE